MKLLYECEEYRLYDITAALGGECALLVTDTEAVLLDCGFAFCASTTYKMVMEILAQDAPGVPLTKILITHSHYDHASACGYFRERIPGLQVYSTAHAQKVFTRPGALATMRRLNAAAATDLGLDEFDDVSDACAIDVCIEDGDVISVGPMDLRVIATPGHTRDTLSFHDEHFGLTIVSETVGLFSSNNGREFDPDAPEDITMSITSTFLVSYEQALESIDRLSALDNKAIWTPHYSKVFVGPEIDQFFQAARHHIVFLHDLIVRLHNEGLSKDEILERLRERYYIGRNPSYQPEPAFELNTSITINLVLPEDAS